MSRYKAYPEYKDSGEDWLGEAQRHWIPAFAGMTALRAHAALTQTRHPRALLSGIQNYSHACQLNNEMTQGVLG